MMAYVALKLPFRDLRPRGSVLLLAWPAGSADGRSDGKSILRKGTGTTGDKVS